MGVNTPSFDKTLVSNSLDVTTGTGSSDGFAVGGTEGTSFFEIKGQNGQVYVAQSLSINTTNNDYAVNVGTDMGFSGGRIHGVSDPSSSSDVATKHYVDLVNETMSTASSVVAPNAYIYTVTIGGTVTPGDEVNVALTSDGLSNGGGLYQYTAQEGDTPATIAAALEALMAEDSALSGSGITNISVNGSVISLVIPLSISPTPEGSLGVTGAATETVTFATGNQVTQFDGTEATYQVLEGNAAIVQVILPPFGNAPNKVYWFTCLDSTYSVTVVPFQQDYLESEIITLTVGQTAGIVNLPAVTGWFNLALPADGGGSNADAVQLGGPTSSAYAQAPTSGSMVDEYWVDGDWTSTGDITATRLRLYCNGTITLNHNITVTTELKGGSYFSYGATQLNNVVGNGQGLGGAVGGFSSGNANGQNGGGGGGFGGQGGQGANDDSTMGVNQGGYAYHISQQFCGSGGGAGGCPSSGISEVPLLGGDGGGSIYLEAGVNIVINGNISCNGGNGQGDEVHGDLAGAGGGSGGAIEARCKGSFTNAGIIESNGGNGGDAQGVLNPTGGGGGGGGYIRIRCNSYTNNGTVQALAGNAGAYDPSYTPLNLADDGSAGIVDILEVVWGPRTF